MDVSLILRSHFYQTIIERSGARAGPDEVAWALFSAPPGLDPQEVLDALKSSNKLEIVSWRPGFDKTEFSVIIGPAVKLLQVRRNSRGRPEWEFFWNS